MSDLLSIGATGVRAYQTALTTVGENIANTGVAGYSRRTATLNEVNRELGLPEMPEFDPDRRGAADSGFVAADVAVLGGLGAVGGGAHADGEWIDLTSLPRQALRNAALIGRLTSQRR